MMTSSYTEAVENGECTSLLDFILYQGRERYDLDHRLGEVSYARDEMLSQQKRFNTLRKLSVEEALERWYTSVKEDYNVKMEYRQNLREVINRLQAMLHKFEICPCISCQEGHWEFARKQLMTSLHYNLDRLNDALKIDKENNLVITYTNASIDQVFEDIDLREFKMMLEWWREELKYEEREYKRSLDRLRDKESNYRSYVEWEAQLIQHLKIHVPEELIHAETDRCRRRGVDCGGR